jgi:26S proteasome regulatory subunit N7
MEKTTGIGARIDLVLAKVRLGLFSFDNELVSVNITKALE